jgi:ankyrin repeat protein
LDLLANETTPKAMRHMLEVLSKRSNALDHTYEMAMKTIERQTIPSQQLAKQVLLWITCAKRPLTPLELQHALAIEIGESNLDKDNLPEIDDMVSVCAGLVTVDEEHNVIRLVHYTTQEYFERTQKHWFPDAEEDMAKICLTYLLFNAFDTGFCAEDKEFEERLQNNPLYDYTAHNWGHHARAALIAADPILTLFKSESKLSACTQAMFVSKRYPSHSNYSQDFPKYITGVHIAAYFGLREAVSLPEDGHYPDLKDSCGQTPLSYAARNGHEEVAKLLLATNIVEPDSKSTNDQTPLWWAARNGHEEVVKLLLATNAVEPDSRSTNGQTPLWWAARNGHEVVVKLLLATDRVNVNLTDRGSETALLWAARNRHEAVVKLLLQRADAVKNFGAGNEQALLSRAVREQQWEMIELLLQRDDITLHFEGGRHTTLLFLAAEKGHERVVDLLLQRYAAIADSRDSNSRTPLSWAAENGQENVVQLLLQRNDVSVESRDNNGRTPLSWAAEKGQERVVDLLLQQYAAAADSRDRNSRTPLSWAAEKGQERVVDLLLQRYAAIADSRDSNSRTPLSWAAENGQEKAVQLLLQRDDVSVESRDNNGRTPLSWAAERGQEQVIEILLAHKADISAKARNGWTGLYYAAKNGHEGVVRMLLTTAGANSTSGGDTNTTALLEALKANNSVVVKQLLPKDSVTLRMLVEQKNQILIQQLLDAGYNVDTRDSLNRTSLHHAILSGNYEITELLLSSGANIDLENSDGKTALQLALTAVQHKNCKLITLLLEHSAHTNGITINEWLDALKEGLDVSEREVQHIVLLSAKLDGKKSVKLITDEEFDEKQKKPARVEKRLLCVILLLRFKMDADHISKPIHESLRSNS